MSAARLTAIVMLVLGAAASHASAAARAVHPRLAAVQSFALALGDAAERSSALARLAHFDLVVLDGESAPRDAITTLQEQGTVVLGYLSVGTIERGRSWSEEARPYRLDHWDDWDEWFAQVSNADFAALIAGRVAPSVLDRGFDGLFLDNVDMIADHPREQVGMELLVRDLSELTHARAGVLFAQNGEDVIQPMIGLLDGWNREDVTGTYDFESGRYLVQPTRAVRSAQRALRRIADSGLLVTATDYVADSDVKGARRATRNACAAGALSFVSDIGLNRVPPVPARCTSG